MYSMAPTNPKSAYAAFLAKGLPKQQGRVLTFLGVEGYDVYNPSVPFSWQGKRVMAGRVEPRANADARIMFFEETDAGWQLIPDAFVFEGMEDPFVTHIGGHTILGGVHAIWRPNGELITYHTDFYCVDDLRCPKHVLQGPSCMKDIRLLELPDGRVAVFSRPNGEAVKGLPIKASIGIAIVASLSEVIQEVIASAPMIQWAFDAEAWGGANQLVNLKGGLIGLIGHMSWGEQQEGRNMLHYYSMAAVVDPEKQTVTPFEVISSRECFPAGPAKRSDLVDVCFTSGIERLPDGTARLYSGLSDAQVGMLTIPDPFAGQ